ncbi:hypothetical protein L1887_33196 [Cichorium endivia]|nr:hypothetical protein L1887_33196 [Cichorium endivia]
MEESDPGCPPVPGNSAHTVALEFDLNETPLPSSREEAAGGNGDGSTADHGCGLCGEAEGQVVVCFDSAKHFQVECFWGRLERRELTWSECLMECRSEKRLRRTVSACSSGDLGLVDMNVSPPREVEDDGAGFWVNSELALTNSAPNMQDTCRNPFIDFNLTSSNTHTNTRHVTNGFPSTTTSHSTIQIAHMNLDIPTQTSIETNENGGSPASLQNGSHATKSVEIGGNHGSESFPIQFEDLFVMSIGKVNPQSQFHNTHQIWPIGYKSIWHDKLTGSIFVCNVLEGDDYGPIFRVNRHPCSKQSLPNASTVIHKPKCGPSDDISNSLTAESENTHTPSHNNNFINGDVIGEFMVEGRSTSSAWQMGLETLISACQHAFQDLNVVNFHCNHNRQRFYGSYGVDLLDKFGCFSSYVDLVDRIPNSILTKDQLEVSCMVIRRWLEMDRFGLDAEFVQELIEQIPGVNACSEYISLDARCQNEIARTVGSGFFTVLHKYNSQPLISDSLQDSCKRLGPPGSTIASNLPPCLIGDVLQVNEFFLRFHKVLGQDAPLSRQNIEMELLDPWINGWKPCGSDKIKDVTSCSTITPDTGVMLSNFHMAMLKVLVEDMLSKVTICDPFGAMEVKSRKGRKRNMDFAFFNKKIEPGIFPINEITWPEIARRYILVLLFLDDNYEAPDLTNREFDQVFHCLNGGGGPLCGSFTGMTAVEADAMILTEASKRIFSSMKSKIGDFVIDKDLDINESVTKTKRTDNKCPEWIKVLEPIRRQPTNVGARIRNRVFKSLEKDPPEWAKEMLLRSISKDVYKGNASGPTKKIVVSVLDKVRDETPLTKKKVKESRVVRTVSDVIIKRCRMVLRAVAVEDENKAFFGFIKPNEFDDVATVSRLLDFRTIDLRLDAGFYDDSHESFIEDVREVWENLRIRYRNNPKYIDSIETISRKLEELYKQEVLTLVSKTMDYGNNHEETKKELNVMMIDTITSTLFIAPWEDGICKVCGKDENDHVLLLCDRCDAEYHTYCLDPPLQRVPKASWYCPPCISFITSQTMSREDDYDYNTPMLSHASGKKKSQREFTRNGLEEIADLADAMEAMEYWELGVKQRVFLVQFLCDEVLSSTVIQNEMSEDGFNIKNFLGRDMDGRLYWVLGRPERLFMSGPHTVGELRVTSESSSWVCYESDAEIEALFEWLKDDDAKEKELKGKIKKWQRNKWYRSYDLNDHSGEVDRFRPSVHCTNARAELEKKFGLLLDDAIPFRCDCLEFVGPTRHHCFSCHSTFSTNEGHQCEVEGITGKNPFEVDKTEGIIGKNRSLLGKASEILQFLKIILFDIEAALPNEAFRPSRNDPNRLRVWRAFLKSAQSIYEMVQATIILEDMIKTEYLRKEWRYWSSPSSAATIRNVSALALQIYALDASVFYEKPPPVDLPESVIPVKFESKEETPKKSKLKSSWKSCSSTMEVKPLPMPPVDLPESVIPVTFESKEGTPKKSKVKNSWKSSSSTTVAMLEENPPPVDQRESVMPGNSESKEETPKKSKLKDNWKARSSTMVEILNDSEPIKNFIPKSKSRKELDVFDFSD